MSGGGYWRAGVVFPAHAGLIRYRHDGSGFHWVFPAHAGLIRG